MVLRRCPSVCKGWPACTLVEQAQPRVSSSDISQLPVAVVAVGFAGAMEWDHGCTTSALSGQRLCCLLGCDGGDADWHHEQPTV